MIYLSFSTRTRQGHREPVLEQPIVRKTAFLPLGGLEQLPRYQCVGPNRAFHHELLCLKTRMVYSQSEPPHYRGVILLGLTGLFCVSAAFADQSKKEVHSQADLPRATYP